MRQERISRVILVVLLALVGLFVGVAWSSNRRVMTIHARMPEQGGWIPGELTARVGETLHLRLVSDDVTHSFTIGQMGMAPIDLFAGEVVETSLTFDKPGKYTYYCTRWCGPNHWRMRGTIDVLSEEAVLQEIEPVQPLYIELGIDIDAPHPAQVIPDSKPDAASTSDPFRLLDESFTAPRYYRSHSPAEVWQDLRLEPSLEGLSDEQVWTLVAEIWFENTSPQQMAAGRELYTINCAACHGENGAGDGVFSGQLDETGDPEQHKMEGQDRYTPTDFTDPVNMLGASPALLHGKIVRGGMGTGMPYWGPIFTDDQIWALVSYLYSFQFNYFLEVNRE